MRSRSTRAESKDHSLIDDATAIKLHAERRLGQMIAEQKERIGLNKGGRPTKTPATKEGVFCVQ
jgi:hypothetical protein